LPLLLGPTEKEIERWQAIEEAARDVLNSHFGIAPEFSWDYAIGKLIDALDAPK
jgi:hypothetical protein